MFDTVFNLFFAALLLYFLVDAAKIARIKAWQTSRAGRLLVVPHDRLDPVKR
jgi:hypothetical protein